MRPVGMARASRFLVLLALLSVVDLMDPIAPIAGRWEVEDGEEEAAGVCRPTPSAARTAENRHASRPRRHRLDRPRPVAGSTPAVRRATARFIPVRQIDDPSSPPAPTLEDH